MLKTKIASMVLAGIMAMSTMGVTALADDGDTKTTPSGMTVQEFRESGHTAEGLKNAKANLDEKGITLEEAKANFEGKFNEHLAATGLTAEEAKAKMEEFKASGKSIDGLKDIRANLEEKGITLEEAKANFAGNFNGFAEAAGLTPEEAKAKIAEMRESGKTMEGLKNFKDTISNIPSEE